MSTHQYDSCSQISKTSFSFISIKEKANNKILIEKCRKKKTKEKAEKDHKRGTPHRDVLHQPWSLRKIKF